MIYWDCFLEVVGVVKILIRSYDLSNCRGDGNMFLSACRKNYYSQDVSYRLDSFKLFIQ